MQHTVIPSWYQREGYVKAMATLIENELSKFTSPQQVCCILYFYIFFNAAFIAAENYSYFYLYANSTQFTLFATSTNIQRSFF